MILIGATALRLQRDLPRFTKDLDLVLALEIEDYPGELAQSEDWRQHPLKPHEWHHKGRVPCDLLPAGATLIAQGHIQWPNDFRMSLRGFDALTAAILPLAEADLSIEMATVPLIALLKMVSWMDRPAERQRDVSDIAWLLTSYLDESNDEHFNRLIEAVGYGVMYETASAYCLGVDVSKCLGAAGIAREFVETLEGSQRWARGALFGKPRTHFRDDDHFHLSWGAFQRGLGVLRQG